MRNIIIGRNSKVWKTLQTLPALKSGNFLAISHKDAAGFYFRNTDLVWIFSYSRLRVENVKLLQAVRNAGANDVVYVSTATTNVVHRTSCYLYPREKLYAQLKASEICDARILVIGTMYLERAELFDGPCIATSYSNLATFVAENQWPEGVRLVNLIEKVNKPYGSPFDRWLFKTYGRLLDAAGRFPCLLRPIDLLLHSLNKKPYGYVHLSNKIWFSTTS
jgi:hypothetical protein